MYSASLCKERFLEIRRLLKSKSRKISRTLEKCNRVLLEWKRECEDYQIRKNISELILPLMNLCGELEDFLEEEADGEVHEKLLEFYFEVSKFLNIYDLVDDHYVIYTCVSTVWIHRQTSRNVWTKRTQLSFSRQRFFRCSITSVC